MGLDVYLYKMKDGVTLEQIQNEDEKLSYEEVEALIHEERIELPSSKYPDHLFKIGYFRSSYNRGGIDNVLSELGLKGLESILNSPSSQDYYQQPNLESVRKNCLQVLSGYRTLKFDYEIVQCWDNVFNNNISNKSLSEARKLYQEFLEQKDSGDSEWMTRNGFFAKEAIQNVRAVINGGSNGFYIVKDSDPTKADFYEQALEIVLETIDWVLSQPDSDRYVFGWSG